MGDRLSVGNEVGNDVAAEIAGRMSVRCIAAKLIVQEFTLEHIDAHAGECISRSIRHFRRLLGFLDERHDAVVGIDVHDTESAC